MIICQAQRVAAALEPAVLLAAMPPHGNQRAIALTAHRRRRPRRHITRPLQNAPHTRMFRVERKQRPWLERVLACRARLSRSRVREHLSLMILLPAAHHCPQVPPLLTTPGRGRRRMGPWAMAATAKARTNPEQGGPKNIKPGGCRVDARRGAGPESRRHRRPSTTSLPHAVGKTRRE